MKFQRGQNPKDVVLGIRDGQMFVYCDTVSMHVYSKKENCLIQFGIMAKDYKKKNAPAITKNHYFWNIKSDFNPDMYNLITPSDTEWLKSNFGGLDKMIKSFYKEKGINIKL